MPKMGLSSEFGRRRMERTIENLHGHTIVCGWGRAASLVVALNGVADNVYVTFSARSADPHLFIVARANSGSAELRRLAGV